MCAECLVNRDCADLGERVSNHSGKILLVHFLYFSIVQPIGVLEHATLITIGQEEEVELAHTWSFLRDYFLPRALRFLSTKAYSKIYTY